MQFISRRSLMGRITALAVMRALARTPLSRAQGTENNRAFARRDDTVVHVSVNWNRVIARIPDRMLGLSYESSQLAAPDFFSRTNTELIGLFRNLSSRGVLRLGGNLSEYTVWTPDFSEVPVVPFRSVGADPSSGEKIAPVPVSKQAIRNLSEFLDRTGWKIIYGLSLAKTAPMTIAEEAKFIAQTLGPRLMAFQIGNEPDHYVMNKLRNPGYSFEEYFAEWTRVHDAVLAALPAMRFAGPDIAEDVGWIRDFAQRVPSSVTMLTGHHYAEGPPSDPAMTIKRLLATDTNFNRRLASTMEICREAKLPYVMSETNSCYKAGKEGVSDVFASALWAIDYVLQLAAAGQQGVYFHGGANGWYTPIAGGSGKPFQARPIYYGLQMTSGLTGAEMVECVTEFTHVSVYALRNPRRLVVVNKGAADAIMQIHASEAGTEMRPAQVQRLSAPSLDARQEIALISEPLAHSVPLAVPGFSAAVFELQ